ncbi:MAG: alpha/beta fold hydrolase [Planctomycetota bacterium]
MKSNIPLALRATRGAFSLLSGVAPGAAARAAHELFCTPRRRKRPDREERALCAAEPFPVRDGLRRLAGWRWGDPTAPTVLLAHGWEGRGSQLGAFAEPLVEAGFSAVAWDAPGHGDSPGRTSSLVEFVDALWSAQRAVERGGGEVRAVVAHSFGAAATALAFDEGLDVDAAALIAPPPSLAPYSERFRDTVRLSPRVHERMIDSMERRFKVRFSDLDVEHTTPPASTRLLVVSDEDDREVAPAETERVARHFADAERLVTSGLGHRRILRDPAVHRRVTRFVRG